VILVLQGLKGESLMHIIPHNPPQRPAAEPAMCIIKYQHGLPHKEITRIFIKGFFDRFFTDNSPSIREIITQNVILIV
jgi:hypothetical protein